MVNENFKTTVTWQKSYGSDIEVYLKVKNQSHIAQTLIFSSGQDYEVILYDNNNNVLWKYSEGKVFTMALRNIVFKPGEEKTYSIIIPYQTPENYLVEVYYFGLSKKIPVDKFNIKTD